MVRLTMSDGSLAIVDIDMIQEVQAYSWYCNSKGPHKYAACWRGGKNVLLHRLVMPDVKEVDHINGDTLDCRRANLRAVTRSQNTLNRKPNVGHERKGATFDKRRGRWMAQIRVDKKAYHLGMFDTKEQAYDAYDAASLRLCGEYAFAARKELTHV